jgi:hypothetical protein
MSPRTVVHDIETTYHARIRAAQNLIYIETQFFRDRAMARELCDRARTCPELRLFLVLPAAPESVAFRDDPALDGRYGDHLQTKCLRKLRRAFGDRLLRHWMGDLGDVGPDTSAWFDQTAEMIRTEATHAPSTRSTLLVPHDIAAGAQTAVPVPGMPPEMV